MALTLEDLARLTDRETQFWIRNVQVSTLAILLKAEQAPFADKLYRNLSEKVAEFLRADVTAMAAPSLQEIEAAKSALFMAVQLAMTQVEEEIAAERPRFEQTLRTAQAGDAVAMFSVAEFYNMGIGIRQDREQASHWYDQAAKAGFPGIGGSTRKGILTRFADWVRNLRTSPRLEQTGAKPTELLIRHEKFDDGYRELLVRIDSDGDLVLDGCDAGELARETFGDWDYEYWLTVPAEWKDTLLLHLVKERFSSVHDMQEWLEKREIPGKFTSY